MARALAALLALGASLTAAATAAAAAPASHCLLFAVRGSVVSASAAKIVLRVDSGWRQLQDGSGLSAAKAVHGRVTLVVRSGVAVSSGSASVRPSELRPGSVLEAIGQPCGTEIGAGSPLVPNRLILLRR